MTNISREQDFATLAQYMMKRALGTGTNAVEILNRYNGTLEESLRAVRADLGMNPLGGQEESELVSKLRIVGGEELSANVGSQRLASHLRSIADRYSTHGEPVLGSDMDYAVALWEKGALLGSGVLIAPKVVITAGHVAKSSLDQPEIFVGNEVPEVLSKLPKGVATPHEKHSTLTGRHDIGIVILESALEAPSPVEIASTEEIDAADSCVVVGFGEMLGNDAGVKRKADLLLFRCDETNHGAYACHEGRELIAAHVLNGSRRDDSGGPLLIKSEDSRLKLAGITSRHAFSSVLPGQEDKKYWIEIYVRVDQYLGWINSTLVKAGLATV